MINSININDLNWDGNGVGRLDNGRVVFVERTIPGDRISIKVRETGNKGRISTELLEILQPSADRIEHPCPHYNQGCPGCVLGVMRYEAALKWKKNHLYETLRRIGGLEDPNIREIEFSENNWRYRDRIELHLTVKDGLKLGYRGNIGDFIVIDDCMLAADNIRLALKAVNGRLKTLSLTTDILKSLKYNGPRILLRDNGLGGAIAVVFIENANGLTRIFQDILNVPELAGFQIRQTENIKSRLFKSKLIHQVGDTKILHKFDDAHKLIIETTVFTQTNLHLYLRLVSLVFDLLPSKGRIADLYGGFGAFSINCILANDIKADVYESSVEAVAAGQRFAVKNGLPLSYIKKDLSRESRKRTDWSKYSALILDPPRKGADKTLLKGINESGPGVLVYVSCHPAALSRDMKILSRYQPYEFIPVDMFPQTPDLETVALLKRK